MENGRDVAFPFRRHTDLKEKNVFLFFLVLFFYDTLTLGLILVSILSYLDVALVSVGAVLTTLHNTTLHSTTTL